MPGLTGGTFSGYFFDSTRRTRIIKKEPAEADSNRFRRGCLKGTSFVAPQHEFRKFKFTIALIDQANKWPVMSEVVLTRIASGIHGYYVHPMPTDHLLSHRFEMRATDSWLHRVDEWRRIQLDIPSRAEAIRRLVELGLKAKV